MSEEYLEFVFYEEWTAGYRGKGRPEWFRCHDTDRNESWYYNLSWAELGIFHHLARLSLTTNNKIPTTKKWLRASCSQHGGVSLEKTINKFIDLGVFVRKKCALEEKRGKEKKRDARSVIVGAQERTKLSIDDVRKQLEIINKKPPLATALPTGALAAKEGENEKRP